MKNAFLVAAVILGNCATEASEIGKTPIFVEGDAKTVVGKDFIFEVKEQIRSSNRLEVSSSESTFYHLKLAVLEMERPTIAYSAVWTFRNVEKMDVYSGHLIGICPIKELQICARSLLAATDEHTTIDWGKAFEGFELTPPQKQ